MTKQSGASIKKRRASSLISSYWLTRIVFLRSLALIYGVAFLISIDQNEGLIGTSGLLPASLYLERIQSRIGRENAIRVVPTIFWFTGFSDTTLLVVSYVGLALSLLVSITGAANWIAMALLWGLYHSLVNVGQSFYSFGWESQLLETGFLAIFLCPVVAWSKFPQGLPTPWVCIWGYRWLIFRIMLGAGLIKIRGDPCWHDLTCMDYFYQTMPVPNPLTWYFHHAPSNWHQFETMTNHVVELIMPFLLLLGRPLRNFGGAIQIVFQAAIIISGNLSFLNWLTILPCIFCFDDYSLSWMFSQPTISYVMALSNKQRKKAKSGILPRELTSLRPLLHLGLMVLLTWLSIPVVNNLLSPRQAMNTSFDRWRILNTYGAFGSITKTRHEVILSGTTESTITPFSEWLEYEFKCKPGSVSRRPCLISPYHYRLDWLMWFAGFQNYQQNPWLLHLAIKLLQGDSKARSLIAVDPFQAKGQVPKYIRAQHWKYTFTKPGSNSTDYWERSLLGEYFPPISLDNESLQQFCRDFGCKL